MEPDRSEKLCPNCGKPLLYRAVRCLECGKSLRPAWIEFDLEPDEPVADAPILTHSPLLDRWLGATGPFLLSLLWLGTLAFAAPESLAQGSLLAAPVLRFLLPLTLSRSLATKFPWMATGLKNALWSAVSFAVALGVAVLCAIPLWLAGAFLTACSGGINGSPRPFDSGVRLTPALLATTLAAQGLLAGTLPPDVSITLRGIRLPKRARSLETFLATVLVIALALRWVLPADWKEGQSVLAGLAALLLVALGVRRSVVSEHLAASGRAVTVAVVLLLGAGTFWAVR